MIFLFYQEQTKNANRMVPRLGVLRYPTSLINLPSVIIFLPLVVSFSLLLYKTRLSWWRQFEKKERKKKEANRFQSRNYMFSISNRNTRARCETYSNLTINTPERRHLRDSGASMVNFEHNSQFLVVFLLLTVNR